MMPSSLPRGVRTPRPSFFIMHAELPSAGVRDETHLRGVLLLTLDVALPTSQLRGGRGVQRGGHLVRADGPLRRRREGGGIADGVHVRLLLQLSSGAGEAPHPAVSLATRR
ncbi:uncharacterized protein Tco025E_07371 [Trypanosoma conorhini]|uniref:Uncharacterized protein n=1 Tax=Trypanosoma conorhini TaxID=83891 RepID=A0A3R7NTH5_9TRYP|nr:uncharacterized protein Tco025E_07371 [Trypanosoma conorhini]RNF07422.1 hypothetical protein Tco025E_07371 [Trypanosoma conorhini]